jgi:hypothetical protein
VAALALVTPRHKAELPLGLPLLLLPLITRSRPKKALLAMVAMPIAVGVQPRTLHCKNTCT